MSCFLKLQKLEKSSDDSTLKDITKARTVSKIKTITTPVKQVFKSVKAPLQNKMKRMKTRLNDVMEQNDGIVNGSYQSTDENNSQLSTPQLTSRGFKSEIQFSNSPMDQARVSMFLVKSLFDHFCLGI